MDEARLEVVLSLKIYGGTRTDPSMLHYLTLTAAHRIPSGYLELNAHNSARGDVMPLHSGSTIKLQSVAHLFRCRD